MLTNTLILKTRPEGLPHPGNFEFVRESLPAPQTGQLLLQTHYISVDPYLRGKMSGTKIPRFELNKPLSSKIIAQVIDSHHAGFKKGDWVSHYLDWKEFQLSDGTGLVKLDPDAAPLSAWLGVLGVTGLSAYFALLDIGKPKPGETLVVSGAAGAVGSIAGQIGKLYGCRVVGIAGSAEKTRLLTHSFGFDAVIANINPYGRIPVCGTIANYNDTEQQNSPALLPQVVYKFLTIRGFLIADFAPRFPEGIAQLSRWLRESSIKYTETILTGFDQLPQAFIGLFEGRNQGKMIVKV